MAEPYLKIGDVAKKVGVSPSVIRSWESLGLARPRRTESKYRLYTAEDVKLLKRARFLRKVRGLNAAAIVQLLKREGKVHPAGDGNAGAIGAHLRQLRARRKLSLAQVADAVARLSGALGQTQTVSAWQTADVARFRLDVAQAVAVAVEGLSPNDVVEITREVAPRDTVLVTDVGANKLIVLELWDAYAAGDFLMSNGLATMGFCLPGAIGAKLADPERPVVGLCGDAGFLMRLPELLTARRH